MLEENIQKVIQVVRNLEMVGDVFHFNPEASGSHHKIKMAKVVEEDNQFKLVFLNDGNVCDIMDSSNLIKQLVMELMIHELEGIISFFRKLFPRQI